MDSLAWQGPSDFRSSHPNDPAQHDLDERDAKAWTKACGLMLEYLSHAEMDQPRNATTPTVLLTLLSTGRKWLWDFKDKEVAAGFGRPLRAPSPKEECREWSDFANSRC